MKIWSVSRTSFLLLNYQWFFSSQKNKKKIEELLSNSIYYCVIMEEGAVNVKVILSKGHNERRRKDGPLWTMWQCSSYLNYVENNHLVKHYASHYVILIVIIKIKKCINSNHYLASVAVLDLVFIPRVFFSFTVDIE